MHRFRYLFFLLLGLILAACGPGEVADDDSLNPGLLIAGDQVPQISIAVKTWLDAPLNNDHIPLAPYNMVFHASSKNMVIGFRVKVNGAQLTTTAPIAFNTVGTETLSYGEFLWTPPAPGIYLIEIFSDIYPRDTLTDDGAPAVANVTVGDPADTDSPTEVAPTEVVIEPTPVPAVPMFNQATIYWGGSCTPTQVQAEYKVQVDNIFNVVMFYRLQDMTSSAASAWTGVSMNMGVNDYYVRTLTSGEMPDHTMFQSAYVYFQFVVTGDDGEELLRSDVFSNLGSLMACEEIIPPQCSDGIDNDGDGGIDFGTAEEVADGTADRQCSSPEDDDEEN